MDRVGMVIGKTKILRLHHESARGRSWVGECTCGREFIVHDSAITRAKKFMTCGQAGCAKRIHGHTHGPRGGRQSSEYGCWISMRERCQKPNSKGYVNYGGRGIRVCERWDSFENFLSDMGHRPSPRHQLDRADNDGDYTPENCRWVTRAENQANRRITVRAEYKGEMRTVSELVAISGMPYHVIRGRLAYGWSAERAMTEPVKRSKQ